MLPDPTYEIEQSLKDKGYKYIIGVDEVGRGPLAGPVVAAAVHIPDGFDTDGIKDSKKLSSKKRELFYNTITDSCPHAIIQVGVEIIDEINIREATKLAMSQCIYKLSYEADYVIVDGNFVPELLVDVTAEPIIKGDTLSVSIAAASIIAKVTRDRYMTELHVNYPIYAWDRNKGYGTKVHRDAIKLYGPCQHHRLSFGGVKQYV
jgi:ribonuclease HII